MSDEPTPRTDAAMFYSGAVTEHGDGKEEWCDADFARELERELAAKAHALELSNTAYSELERENARLKQWNLERAGQFAVRENRMSCDIAKLREALTQIETRCERPSEVWDIASKALAHERVPCPPNPKTSS